jgi:hypothetical protein
LTSILGYRLFSRHQLAHQLYVLPLALVRLLYFLAILCLRDTAISKCGRLVIPSCTCSSAILSCVTVLTGHSHFKMRTAGNPDLHLFTCFSFCNIVLSRRSHSKMRMAGRSQFAPWFKTKHWHTLNGPFHSLVCQERQWDIIFGIHLFIG